MRKALHVKMINRIDDPPAIIPIFTPDATPSLDGCSWSKIGEADSVAEEFPTPVLMVGA